MRVLLALTLISLPLAACQTMQDSRNAALEQRVAKLEAQLDDAQSRQITPRQDPIMNSYTTLQRIQNSPANQISTLSYVRGSYGSNVTVYPVDGSSQRAAVSSVLKKRSEGYGEDMMQIGNDLYTPTHSKDVVVYDVDNTNIPVVTGSMEYPEPVKAVTKRPTTSRVSSPVIREESMPMRPAREGRQLTSYDSSPSSQQTTSSTMSSNTRSLTGY